MIVCPKLDKMMRILRVISETQNTYIYSEYISEMTGIHGTTVRGILKDLIEHDLVRSKMGSFGGYARVRWTTMRELCEIASPAAFRVPKDSHRYSASVIKSTKTLMERCVV